MLTNVSRIEAWVEEGPAQGPATTQLQSVQFHGITGNERLYLSSWDGWR